MSERAAKPSSPVFTEWDRHRSDQTGLETTGGLEPGLLRIYCTTIVSKMYLFSTFHNLASKWYRQNNLNVIRVIIIDVTGNRCFTVAVIVQVFCFAHLNHVYDINSSLTSCFYLLIDLLNVLRFLFRDCVSYLLALTHFPNSLITCLSSSGQRTP